MRTETPGVRCPWCGYGFDVARSVTREEKPHPDAVTVCFNCLGVSVFTDTEGNVRRPTPQEKVKIDQNRDVRLIRLAIRNLRSRRN